MFLKAEKQNGFIKYNRNMDYRKLSQREHVLLRPETYIGTTSKIEEDMYIMERNDIESDIIKKRILYSPGFIKIFDEALVNATDHFIRTGKVKNIKIKINSDDGFIEIFNDGSGIPIIKNNEDVWIPEMIFFNFLSGSNFDDSKERFTGGRNGLGIKATATFSKKFIIEISDGKKKYVQESNDNLLNIEKPKIVKSSSKDEYVSIKYFPDFERFNMKNIDDISISIMLRRILESVVYCSKKVKFYYNNKLINNITPLEYCKLLNKNEIFYEKINNEWDLCVSKTNIDQFDHSSMVNGISTYNGGTHINWVSLTLSKNLVEMFPKKFKDKISWNDVKNNLFILFVCKIPNPTFNSQSKDQLTNYFGKDLIKDYIFPPTFLKKIFNSDIIKSLIDKLIMREKMELSKIQGKKAKVEKLVDATFKDRSKCELFVFEGDSAGQPMRQYRSQNQGYFCLRGKFINVYDMDGKSIIENKEAFGLMQSIGLKWGHKVDKSELRYSKIIITTDSDIDGDCISAQLLNFLSHWPDLFEIGMIYRNITPLLVAEDIKTKKEFYFYTQEEYDLFYEKNKNKFNYNIQYKKGIGSLDSHQFKKIINDPILYRFSLTDECKNKLKIWFGKDAQLRKNEMIR